RKIIRVDISVDNGKNWINAELTQESTPLNRTWSWTLWEVSVKLLKNVKITFSIFRLKYQCLKIGKKAT
ncbi:hypothetical protein ACXIU3_24445, partial [Vibrio parahaemolyticus]